MGTDRPELVERLGRTDFERELAPFEGPRFKRAARRPLGLRFAAMIDWQGWLSALGGPAAAAGLLIAGYELRAGRAERLDNEAAQARLVTIERQPVDGPYYYQFGCWNRSDAPVFDLKLEWVGYIERRDDEQINRRFPELVMLGHSRQGGIATHPGAPLVFMPGESVWGDFEWSYPEWYHLAKDQESLDAVMSRLGYGVTINFVDANGRRWQRTNMSPPIRIIRGGQTPWWHWRLLPDGLRRRLGRGNAREL